MSLSRHLSVLFQVVNCKLCEALQYNTNAATPTTDIANFIAESHCILRAEIKNGILEKKPKFKG